MNRVFQLTRQNDLQAIAVLALLWLLFFWRLFTPIAADQASVAVGDFSGQFFTWATYQYQRMSAGEIPLWNPYNYGGLPFIGDPQAAVFYPPRWITIGLSNLLGEWNYNSLQMEMTFHVLLYTLLMYAFVRRLTLRQSNSPLAAFAAAVIIGYGGYTTGYVPLQLAVLEAALWLPLGALGILEATRGRRLSPQFIALAGCGIGLSWLAGHPQTSWFLTYVIAGYFAYRCYAGSFGWRAFIGGLGLLCLVSLGVTAVTLIPGLEYLGQATRDVLGFADKGNGFPFRDITQFVFAGSVSQWSPLYLGIPALFFVGVAVLRRAPDSAYWLLAACAGLLLSLGDNSAFYHAVYNFIPGLRYFRGQERSAFVVVNCLTILAGIGVAAATNWPSHAQRKRAISAWAWFTRLVLGIAILGFFAWTHDGARWGNLFEIAARSALATAAAYFVISRFLANPSKAHYQLALIALIVFELFSVNIDNPTNYVSVPYDEQLPMSPPALVQAVVQDENSGQPFRVDAWRGFYDNRGSIYGVMDIRGISPLILKGPDRIIYADYVNNPLAWELFAVKYVYSDAERLSVPSQIVDRGQDWHGPVNLHQLEDPRPFARLYYEADIVDSDAWALQLMDDIRYHERDKIVIHRPPTLELSGASTAGTVTVTSFAPEEIALDIDTAENAILSLSMPHYPGWEARLNGLSVPIIRAYAGLSAVEIPAGAHSLSLEFAPRSYAIGALVSLTAWFGLALLAIQAVWRKAAP